MPINVNDKKKTPPSNQQQTQSPSPSITPTIKNTIGDKIVEGARSLLGISYTDVGLCTGLSSKAYAYAGIDIPPTLVEHQIVLAQEEGGLFEDFAFAIAGDLIFYNKEHVGIYCGNGMIIHASSSRQEVVCVPFDPDGAGYPSTHLPIWYGRYQNPIPLNTNPGKVIGSNTLSDSAKAYHNARVKQDSLPVGFTITGGKQKTIFINPKGKAPCEPIYPDLISVTNTIPAASLEKELAQAAAGSDLVLPGLHYIVTAQQIETLTGLNALSFYDGEQFKGRQKIYDTEKHRYSVKAPTAGKPLNNNDAFPIDSKIEELEMHQKRAKIQKITLNEPSSADIELAKHLLNGIDATEKRLVKLENLLATYSRYLFALGSRLSINCVYYGGQDRSQKYKCIRCLKDNLVDDGQIMQIDQCLSCTRFEPVIGQTYDILNETGANLAALQDTAQMSYMTMNDYVAMSKINEYVSPLPDAALPTKDITTKNSAYKTFSEEWDAGLTMKWNLVPVEEQKPQINWRQDINGDEMPKRLASYQYDTQNFYSSSNYGLKISIGAGQLKAFMQKNFEAIKNSAVPEIQALYTALYESIANSVNAAINNMIANNYESLLISTSAQKGIDPLLMFALFVIESTGNPNVGNRLGLGQVNKEAQTGLAIENQINDSEDVFLEKCAIAENNMLLAIQFYNCGSDNLFEYTGEIYNQEYYNLLLEGYFGGYASDQESRYIRISYFPKICFAYIIASQNKNCETFLDGQNYRFPFAAEDLHTVYFTSDYGYRLMDGKKQIHNGVDLGTNLADLNVFAVGTGTVTDSNYQENGAGNYIIVEHKANNQTLYSLYMHLSKRIASVGDYVTSTTIIGISGNTGASSGAHLHLEFRKENPTIHAETIDPKVFYPLLNASNLGTNIPLSEYTN